MTALKHMLSVSFLFFPFAVFGASPLEQCRYHFMHGQYDLAVQPCTVVAEQGDLDAQNWLGLIYAKGKGVPQDYNQAFRWKQLAAHQGDATGQYTLGRMYEQGLGTNQDYAEALKWYRMAVAQGNPDAQYSMGSMYRKGKGVVQNNIQAFAWYSLAAEQGMFLAVEAKEKLAAEMSREQLQSAQQVAQKLASGIR